MPLTPPPAENFIEALRSRIVEGRTMDPYQFRPVVIPLQVELSGTRLQGSANFNIPSNQRLLIHQFLPHVVPTNVSAAGNAPSGTQVNALVLGSGGNLDTVIARATNCRVSLAFASRTFEFFVQKSFALSDLLATDGEGGLDLVDMFGPIPQGTTIDLNAALVDSTAAAVIACEYGISIVGTYVQV